MSEKRKRKRDLYATFEHIERFHRRRSIFVMHAVGSLALQVVMWANWYGSYFVRGYGFLDNFFSDRIAISIALVLFLIGHFAVMYLLEEKDRMVIVALRQHEDELDDDEDDTHENDDSAEEKLSAPETDTESHEIRQRRQR